jgi:hypothetical protein
VRQSRTVWVLVLLIVGVVIAGIAAFSRARRVSDLHRITANAQLLSKALRKHQERTGSLPLRLDELVADDGDVIPGYLHGLSNQFIVAYSPTTGSTSAAATILSVAGGRSSVTVSRDFQIHVTKKPTSVCTAPGDDVSVLERLPSAPGR